MIALTTQEQIGEVAKLRDDDNLTFEEIGKRLGFSEKTARRRYQAALLNQAVDGLMTDDLEDFPTTQQKLNIQVPTPFIPEDKGEIERFKPLTRTGDCMITCDFHIPLHDPALINSMINCARQNKIDKLIIAGDYFNMEDFSSYLPYQPEAALDIEKYDGNYIMKALLKTFKEVDFIWGNHDFRLSKKLGFKRSFEECMKWMLSDLSEKEFKKIRFSELDYMHYYPKNTHQCYRIMHPRNFSGSPLTVARKLAQKYNCSVITAHSHHCAIGAAPNGKDVCIEGGGFFDKNRTEYIQKSTTHHEWVQGYTMFKDGLPTLVSPLFGNDVQYRKEVI